MYRIILLTSIFLSFITLYDHTDTSASEYSIKEIRINNADSILRCRDFFQDEFGNMWIATWGDGLIFYDGLRHKTYNSQNSNLVYDHIRTIEYDGHGGLWIGTSEGISHFDGETFINFTHNDLPLNQNDSVFKIKKMKDLTFWFGMDDGKILHWTSDQPPFHQQGETNVEQYQEFWKLIDLPETLDGLPDMDIRDIFEDSNGTVWIGSQTLWQRSGDEWIEHPDLYGVRQILQAQNGNIIVVSLHGIFEYDGVDLNLKIESTKKNTAASLFLNDDLLLGTESGLFQYHNNRQSSISLDSFIPSPFIESLYKDQNNNFWIGSRNGLYELTKPDFTFHSKTAEQKQILGLAFDHRFQTPPVILDENNQLYQYDGSEYQFLLQLPKVSGYYINNSNIIDEQVWFLYHHNAILVDVDSNVVVKNVPIPDDLVPNKIIITENKEVYIIGNQGIYRQFNHVWVRSNRLNLSSENHVVQALSKTKDNQFFIGVNNKLYQYDANTFVDLHIPIKDKYTKIHSIYYSDLGELFVGTNDKGIFQLSQNGWKNYSVNDGLASNEILTFYQDSEGVLWAGSGLAGVSAFIPIRDSDKKKWISQTFKDDVSIQSISTIGEYPKGILWYGSNYNGFYTYNKSTDKPVTISITSASERYVNETCEFSFEGIDYFNKTASEFLRYSWRVKDEDNRVIIPWTDYKRETKASFVLSKPGTYDFEVITIDDDFNIEDIPESKEFKVLALPFYQNPWFFTFILITFLIAVMYLVVLYQTKRKLNAYTAELEEKISNRTAELERSYQYLQQSQKVEVMGNLVSGVVHDFKNMLLGVIGYSELLLDELKEDKKLYDYAKNINNTGKSANTLTKQLLSFVRHGNLEYKNVNITEKINASISILKPLIPDNVSINTEVEPDLGFIKANEAHIDQILINLVVNARDAMPDGGVIRITGKRINPTLHQFPNALNIHTKQWIVLEVIDQGCGISDSNKSKIFEPFFSTKMDNKGTGLGLSTVKAIISEYNGVIDLKSEVNKGTTFSIYLPITEDEIVHHNDFQLIDIQPEIKETILVVEDEEMIRSVLKETLSNQGYEVIVTESAEDAEEVANQMLDSIDIVITDVILPKKNGKELVISLLDKKPSLKVIYMSGYTNEIISKKDFNRRNTRFIEKPFSVDDLIQELRSFSTH